MQPPKATVRPIQRFASAVSKCSVESAAYGKCILADYNSVHKDMCVKEFMRLKDCYMVCISPRPLFRYLYHFLKGGQS
ncbi:hypothetical protein NEUTE1DRAFT_43828 [Neurospora tetrasperma FGSC 2508]|uniref:Uncharacterized protein n=1 Tax=Neurospora tetrasperma (strain FGSC 2508 / ATCC MYA-4615 / P0657) TaxID=510951 RepID=F8MPJ2_NEUT8|nr:uncharacterized protein NEUTE1DRAFT_43828 [Neurospora tetrasperma FGSC 2508]EGO57151.1 hypothetical protein NEUTE1DRAFT_43828 [Neurospora tetrasperma FGSC 2508]EGZ69929.1 hypothetical protein NEUTE2DRAFT_129957 [Neurospora tetrasperma FGSC 2509]